MGATSNKAEYRIESEKKDSRIVAELQRQIADGSKGYTEQQIGCHNDGSGGTHNDN